MAAISKLIRSTIFGCVCVAGLALAGCGGTPGSIDVSGTRSMQVDRGYALSSVNALRARNGLGPLSYSSTLDRASERQAKAMAARNRMSHSLEGKLSSRVSQYGYRWGSIAENIGYGYRDTRSAMQGWIDSSGHKKNILNPRVTEMGFGMAMGPNNIPYWAMIFGTENKIRIR
ncbi:Allergen V5/Tpx-1 related protein [Fulvimarina pelagi HTCC2506]|uniref:Allergen V5/Tpx-1 related protein n=2 Tax=Fulvimarina pelagi TaxID=217511 RepID=Q0G1H4_9HYPH|nr:CAP domain-containing protein [Fulvimarina pelagi]EAU41107.1 Allergen V5/Tpx-1 related protein [Fulvimarina pelagi HTCC2506]BAT30878.1 allergen V5/Tpx-1 related protein [Fulvimarina pelagi]